MNLMTIMYITIQEVLGSGEEMVEVREKLRRFPVSGLVSVELIGCFSRVEPEYCSFYVKLGRQDSLA
jgi:hypothetical protein